MKGLNADTRRFIEMVGTQTSKFLASETRIKTLAVDYYFNNVQRLKLNYLTSIMAVEGQFNVMFAFSFNKNLAEAITKSYLAELEIEQEHFVDYLEETAAEIINIILGNTLVHFQISGEAIDLSPPIVITEAKTIYRTKPVQFLIANLSTQYGNLQICCIAPKKLFDNKLNYIEKSI